MNEVSRKDVDNLIIAIRSSQLSKRKAPLVYCNACGTQADRHDNYCRICGRTIHSPRQSTLWRIRRWLNTPLRSAYSPAKDVRRTAVQSIKPSLSGPGGSSSGIEIDTGRVEKNSATNRADAPSSNSFTEIKYGKRFTQVEQSYDKNSQQELERSLEEALARIRHLENEKDSLRAQVRGNRKRTLAVACYAMAASGILSLVFSTFFGSAILAFVGLGLTFWGALLLLVRPQNYVRSELMDSAAISSLRAIDRVITGLGYSEKGVYLPAGNPEKAVVFIPFQTLKRIPKTREIEKGTFVKDPKGIVTVPPGLELANLFERELGVEFGKCGLETLSKRLPKLLIDDLELVHDFEMHVYGNVVHFKFVESIYSDLCGQLRCSTMICSSLGCSICSAMACVLAQASGRPVVLDGDGFSPDGRILEPSYRILEG